MKMNRSIAMLALGAGAVLAYQRYEGQLKDACDKMMKQTKKMAKAKQEKLED